MGRGFISPIQKKVYKRIRICEKCGKPFKSETRNRKMCDKCKSKLVYCRKNNPKSIHIATQYKSTLERLKKEIFPDDNI